MGSHKGDSCRVYVWTVCCESPGPCLVHEQFEAPIVGGLLDKLTVELVTNSLTVMSCLEDKEYLLLLRLAFGHVVTHEPHNSCSGSAER